MDDWAERFSAAIQRNYGPRPRKHRSPSSRTGPSRHWARLLIAQRGLCGICGCPVTYDQLAKVSVDHVMPRSRGGSNQMGNLQAVHESCNRAKADQLPTTQENTMNHLPAADIRALAEACNLLTEVVTRLAPHGDEAVPRTAALAALTETSRMMIQRDPPSAVGSA